jgi:precorrin-6B methylase 2
MSSTYEFDVSPGLLSVVTDEFRERFPGGRILENHDAEALLVEWDGDPARLTAMRTAASVATVLEFPVARPKALLGDENLRKITNCARAIADTHEFHALRLSAAGSHTPTMERIAAEIAHGVGLAVDNADGDLLVRIRRGPEGWQVLIRRTPRPLSVRQWRVVDYPVAVNACIAAAMVRVANLGPSDSVLNVMCGSATIAIEAALTHRDLSIVAIDNHAPALEAARANVNAAGVDDRVQLRLGDVTQLDFPASSIDATFADPPWSGDNYTNLSRLYEAALAELSRVICPGGRLVWLSHQVEMSKDLLQKAKDFSLKEPITLTQGGLHPSLWLLHRT